MKKYILYAEDDEDDFVTLKHALEEINSHLELLRVCSGYELIRFLQEKDAASFPSLIVIDMKMPMLNGKETLDLLKLDDQFKSIPVVLFSGSTSLKDDTFARAKNSEIIKKPSLYEEWLSIARQLGKYCPVLLLAMVCK